MSTTETSRFVRLRVDLVLEVTESGELTTAALDHIDGDVGMPEEERSHARTSVSTDDAEALAYLVDPFDLVGDIPGTELAQASWACEQVDYDPESEEWALDDDLDDELDAGFGHEVSGKGAAG
jgi:hypothetical protein